MKNTLKGTAAAQLFFREKAMVENFSHIKKSAEVEILGQRDQGTQHRLDDDNDAPHHIHNVSTTDRRECLTPTPFYYAGVLYVNC